MLHFFYDEFNMDNLHKILNQINSLNISKNNIDELTLFFDYPIKMTLNFPKYKKNMIGSGVYEIVIDICYNKEILTKLIGKYDSKTITFIMNPNVRYLHYSPIGNTAKKCYIHKRGSFTLVYVINKENYPEDLILRITEEDTFDVNKYKQDIILNIKDNLPEYLYFGDFIVDNSGKKYFYSICRKYKVMDDMCKIKVIAGKSESTTLETFGNRWIFFNKLINFLVILETKNFLVNDLKMDNVGYDEKFNPVVIDYNFTTISQIISEINTHKCYKVNNKYNGTKHTISGFMTFIFALFFKSAYPNAITYIGKYQCLDFNYISGHLKNEQGQADVNKKYIDFLKMIILDNNGNGLIGKNIPTYKQIQLLINIIK